ncbi:hypothetical protein [Chryseobacterium candidae]|jgi:hypothetical protein|uniref:Uncharacterized protein n=1 Tax=Chryseobacterium candidae TaxID=1978493 RepID=A0ABY2R2B5_9FLAO|nr:hypothetical protein [Chryseobacterium candidae]THV56124.1 hypothetical protein EK417_20835 [Chryseobacterium candidae]
MGIGFVILIHLFAISVFSFICAAIGCLLTYFISEKEGKRNKMILAFIGPFVAFYTFYFVGIIGLSMVSDNKKVDVGIGDAWYVPLKNDHQLLFIDLPEQASINNGSGLTLVSQVAKMEELGSYVFGKTSDSEYFFVDLKTNEVKTFQTEKELSALHVNKKLNLVDATKFYSERKNDIMGYWPLLIIFLSLIVSIGAVYIWKLLLIF